MRRRDFLGVLGGAAVAWPIAANSQTAGRIPTIGVLWHAGSPDEEQPYFDALIQGFKQRGYIEGHNIRFEHRFPNETPERFRQMAAELVALNVTAIMTVGNVTAQYAKAATATIPVVFVFVNDPVGTKLVDTLARPGGNVTGHSVVGIDLTAKRFELLRELVPQVSHVGVPAVSGSEVRVLDPGGSNHVLVARMSQLCRSMSTAATDPLGVPTWLERGGRAHGSASVTPLAG